MAYADEFVTQWESITAFLESEMITQSDKTGRIDLTDVEQKFENEKGRWFVPGQFHYTWMELLRKHSPEVAKEFEAALGRTRLHQVQPSVTAPGALIAGPAVIGAAVGFGVCRLLHLTLIFTGLGTVVLALLGAWLGNNLYREKRYQSGETERAQYVRQLKEMQDQLVKIIAEADI